MYLYVVMLIVCICKYIHDMHIHLQFICMYICMYGCIISWINLEKCEMYGYVIMLIKDVYTYIYLIFVSIVNDKQNISKEMDRVSVHRNTYIGLFIYVYYICICLCISMSTYLLLIFMLLNIFREDLVFIKGMRALEKGGVGVKVASRQVCTYAYAYIYIFIFANIYEYSCVHIRIFMCTYTNIHINKHVYKCTYEHIYKY
jgi:hypothetical protein